LAHSEWKTLDFDYFWRVPGFPRSSDYRRLKWTYDRWSPYHLVPRQSVSEFLHEGPLVPVCVFVVGWALLFAIASDLATAWVIVICFLLLCVIMSAIVKLSVEWIYRP
jgi:hypothetical protein